MEEMDATTADDVPGRRLHESIVDMNSFRIKGAIIVRWLIRVIVRGHTSIAPESRDRIAPLPDLLFDSKHLLNPVLWKRAASQWTHSIFRKETVERTYTGHQIS